MPIVARLLNSLIQYFQKKQKKRRKNGRVKPRPARPKQKHRVRKFSRGRRNTRRPKRTASPTAGFKKSKNQAGTKKNRQLPWAKKGNLEAAWAGRTPKAHVTEACIGEITHYFSRIQVVVLKITGGQLFVGENIRIKGKSTNFAQKVQSLQIESVDVKSARKGQLVGLKVRQKARPGDKVYKIA